MFFNRPSSFVNVFRRVISSLVGAAVIFGANATAQTSPSSPSSHPASASARANSVTVGFWNIQWFPGQRPDATANAERRQIDAVHSEITPLDPDILGMEEVRNFDKAGVAVQPLRGFKV